MKKEEIRNQLQEIQSLLKQKDSKPLNFVEAAQYLSISHSTLYKLTYQRKIPCHKPNGKYLYFFKHELDEWISGSNLELRIENGELRKGRRKNEQNEDEEETETDASAPLSIKKTLNDLEEIKGK